MEFQVELKLPLMNNHNVSLTLNWAILLQWTCHSMKSGHRLAKSCKSQRETLTFSSMTIKNVKNVTRCRDVGSRERWGWSYGVNYKRADENSKWKRSRLEPMKSYVQLHWTRKALGITAKVFHFTGIHSSGAAYMKPQLSTALLMESVNTIPTTPFDSDVTEAQSFWVRLSLLI